MKKILLIFFAVSLIFVSCSKKPLTIAISKGKGSESYENYQKWLKDLSQEVEVIDLYFIDREEALEILKDSDGLLLSGGPDIHPGRYGKEVDSSRCQIDLMRDTLEFEILAKAMEIELPILGVCRGFQVLNVAMGGSLIVDIPTDTDSKVIHQDKTNPDVMHDVKVFENSRLYALSGVSSKQVNSNHHQAIGILADAFMPSAASNDGLIEALEYKENDKPFLMAVGWHPERLPRSHPLSYSVGMAFIKAAEKYKEEK